MTYFFNTLNGITYKPHRPTSSRLIKDSFPSKFLRADYRDLPNTLSYCIIYDILLVMSFLRQ